MNGNLMSVSHKLYFHRANATLNSTLPDTQLRLLLTKGFVYDYGKGLSDSLREIILIEVL